jgi:hypothetical protein
VSAVPQYQGGDFKNSRPPEVEKNAQAQHVESRNGFGLLTRVKGNHETKSFGIGHGEDPLG